MKKNIIKFQLSLVILVAGVAGPPTPLQAYQVWMSTCGASAQTITNPVCWSNVAAQVQGWHFNFLPPACPTNTPGYAQSNAVNLADTNYWFDITGSELATNLVITIRPSQTNVFYRLRYPN